jgi:hypothetical protein
MITVIDSIMGSGKTNYMIDYINKTHHDALSLCFSDKPANAPCFLYVAPLLSEVDRIREACPDLDFRDPKPVSGKKLNHLSELVERGANICTTHALFKDLTREIHEKLMAQNYVLILDEVLSCVDIFEDLTKSDLKLLLNDRRILVDAETHRLQWNHQDHSRYSGKFNTIRNLCDNGNLVLFRDTVIWEFPTNFLKCFDQVFVLTYLFQGAPMSAYLRAAGLNYKMKTIVNNTLVSWPASSHEAQRKEQLRDLITVHEGPANRWGDPKGGFNPFSVGWLEKRAKRFDSDLKGIKASTENWFKNVARTPSADNAWTTFKSAQTHLKGAKYTKGFVACNTKATNDYRHKKSLAYLCNVFQNPMIKGYFEDRGIELNEGAYALSEMIQWMWRSQIRDDQPITVFIPSERMRSLLKQWLNTADLGGIVEAHEKLAA